MSDVGKHDILTTLTQLLFLESIPSNWNEVPNKNGKRLSLHNTLTNKDVGKYDMLLGNNNVNDTQIKEYNNIMNLPINSSFVSLDSFYIDNYALSKVGLRSTTLVYISGSHSSSNNFNTRTPSFSSSNGSDSFSTTKYKFYKTAHNNSDSVINNTNNNNNMSQTNLTGTSTPRLQIKNTRKTVGTLRPRDFNNSNKKNKNKQNSTNQITSSNDDNNVSNNKPDIRNPRVDNARWSNNHSSTVNQFNRLGYPLRRIPRDNFIDELNGSDSESCENGSSPSFFSSSSSSSSSSSCSSSSLSFSSSNIDLTNDDVSSTNSLPFEFAVDPERAGTVVSFDIPRFQGDGYLTGNKIHKDV